MPGFIDGTPRQLTYIKVLGRTELRLIAEWIEENVKDKKLFRMHMVQFAIEHGNKPAAAKFNTTVKTVRKWRRRYEAEGYQGLKELPSSKMSFFLYILLL